METIPAVLMGLSLAACAGLRAFLPLLALGLAARLDWLPVQPWFAWVGSTEALITFGVATVLEVLGDKIPLVDHGLDLAHTVLRPAAGALAAATAFHQLSPAYAVALGIIVGAPIAGGLHLTRAGTRVASTHLTAGFGNPVLSFLEDLVALIGVALALAAPVAAFLLLLLLGSLAYRWLRGRRLRRAAAPPV